MATFDKRLMILGTMVATTLACAGNGLTGSSRTSVGGKKKPSGQGSALGTQEAGETTRGQSGQHGEDQTLSDDGDTDQSTNAEGSDLKVIPPEVVSGAYLTCTAERGDPNDQASSLQYGCAAFSRLGMRLPLAKTQQTWEIKTRSGTAVPVEDLGPSPTHDRRWRILDRIAVSDLDPKVTLTTGTIAIDDQVCTTANVGISRFETCIKLGDVSCAACSKATMLVTNLGGNPLDDYAVVTTEAMSSKGLCAGAMTRANTEKATKMLGGRIKIEFGFVAKPMLCFQVKAEVRGQIVDGAIID